MTAHLPDGYTKDDLNAAFCRLCEATNYAAIEALLDSDPVSHIPAFHQELRRFATDGDDNARHLVSAFFLMAHVRSQRRRKPPAPSDLVLPRTAQMIPPFWRTLIVSLAGHLPEPSLAPPLDPGANGSVVREQVALLTGSAVALPSYEGTEGVRWAVVRVACVACKHEQILVRAVYVDLRVAPHMRDLVRDARVNSDACEACGWHVFLPRWVWFCQGPAPGDTLAALSCIWVVDGARIAYQPPSWWTWEAALKETMEARAEALASALLAEEPPPSDEPRVRTMAIGYTPANLAYHLRILPATVEISFALEASIRGLAFEIREGTCDYATARKRAADAVRELGYDSLVLPAPPGGVEDGPEQLAVALFAEAVGEGKAFSPGIRAELALLSGEAHLMLSHIALAEQALDRATTLAGDAPSEPLKCELASFRGDLESRKGNYEAAHRLRLSVLSQTPNIVDGRDVEVEQWRIARMIAQGNMRLGRWSEAYEQFAFCLDALPKILVREGLSKYDVISARRTQAAAEANAGAVLIDLAKALNSPEGAAEARRQLASLSPLLDGAALTADEVIADTKTADLARRAVAHLHRALAISRDQDDDSFAADQLVRLFQAYYLLDQAPCVGELIELRDRADRAGKRRELVIAARALALDAWREGKSADAIGHVGQAARAVREWMAAGNADEIVEVTVDLCSLALSIGNGLPEFAKAVLLAENLGGSQMARHLRLGLPGRLSQRPGSSLDQLARKKEVEREQFLLNDPDTEEARDAAAALDSIAVQVGRERQAAAFRDERFARTADPKLVTQVTEDGLRRRLTEAGAGSALVGVMPSPRGLWCYAFTTATVCGGWIEWPDWETDLLNALAALHVREEHGSATARLDIFGARLLEPVRSVMHGFDKSSRFFYSPNGPLALLPPACLRFDGRFLAEFATPSMVLGPGGLIETMSRRPSLDSIVALGEPRRDGEGAIPAASAEAQAAARIFENAGRRASLFLREAATIANLTTCARDAGVVHLGCHASWTRDPRVRPFLHLSPDPAARDTGDLTDDRITWDLPLREHAIVVLAACYSGIHSGAAAGLIDGLVPAFLSAGASCVLAASWEVRDVFSAAFVSAFYERLLQALSPAAALADVQRRALAGDFGAEAISPALWGSFAIHGAG